ncbi:hypothetical protein HIM_06602 [Hirsutella minnesotensis 3608]|uniref:DUF676 domain-containing protein n=1 Tax=Hirsutella minnesotensis 3608 TaxID=1043627 RepID=A0A0F8A4P4_9HYPO|nr:hypothetical protein HIM_06602 [Hirsutella minnesotensis 3608]
MDRESDEKVDPKAASWDASSSSSDSRETELKDDASDQGIQDSNATRFILDPAGDLTYDETTVDVVTVPCPGGHPVRSWSRDGLMGRYFGAPSMREAEAVRAAGNSDPRRLGPSWVRQGIRREAHRARILLYEHPPPVPGTTLSGLADALLAELQALRRDEQRERPLVFIAHSIGGLVVKMALTKASRDARYENILRECYGVAFFGTPHQGSSYFAMPSLAAGIQSLLHLSTPLPQSIIDGLRVGNSLLQHVDEDFKCVSNDIRVWTFYETIESRLSGAGGHHHHHHQQEQEHREDVYFTAPLTSIKSAILGMRQETICALQSDHANIASFGRHNLHSLRLFLKQLASQIGRADVTLRDGDGDGRWTLGLEQKVNVEVHGFFDDPPPPGIAAVVDAHEASTIRAWSTRLPLKDFLAKGPDVCLSERLNEVEGPPEQGQFLRAKARGSSSDEVGDEETAKPTTLSMVPMTVKNALGIQDRQAAIRQTVTPGSPIIRPIDAAAIVTLYDHGPQVAPTVSPTGVATPPFQALSPATHQSSPIMRPSSLIQADLEQDLAIDRLSPPLRPRVGRSISRSFSVGGGDRGRIEYREFLTLSPRSRSTFTGAIVGDVDEDDDIEASPRLPEAVLAIRKMVTKVGRASEAAVTDEMPSAFARPDVKARRFVWVHVPFNNPTWVKSVLQTLEVTYKKDYSSLYGHDFWATRHTRGRHPQHYAYFAKPGCYFTSPRTAATPRHSLTSTSLTHAAADEAMYTCLFLPYLHFDSYKRLIRRRNLISMRLGYARARPVPETVAKSDLLELQVIWEYLGHDPPINCRRSLDQFAYPSLRDTRSRDDDQMLYKLTKDRGCVDPESEANRDLRTQGSSAGTSSDKAGSASSTTSKGWRERLMRKTGGNVLDVPEEDLVRNGNVLMIDQLWLWVLQTHTLTTFFPKRESDPVEGPLYQQADLRDSIFSDVNVDLTRQCENALDMAALAALHAVSVLLDRSSHPDLEVFRIFEEAISVLTEKLTWSFKAFRTEGFRDKAFDFEPVENKARSIRARHKAEGRRAEQENRDNTSALLELRDIEDELLTLVHLFERQTKVISSMHAIYGRPELREHTVNGRVFLSEALKSLRDYAQQADEMIQRVRNTREDYDKLLQMVQRQAQVDEVRLSRLHADLASAQSRSVTIFTTFTVIFLPLTFFTGLFGMNTREWGGNGNLPLRTIGIIALPSSFVLVAVALFIAFSTAARRLLRRHVGRKRRRWMAQAKGIPQVNRKTATQAAGAWSGGGAGSGTFGVRMGLAGTRMRRNRETESRGV